MIITKVVFISCYSLCSKNSTRIEEWKGVEFALPFQLKTFVKELAPV